MKSFQSYAFIDRTVNEIKLFGDKKMGQMGKTVEAYQKVTYYKNSHHLE
tara:strand:- start:15 stop:161 length:147 start_codon:yes stop_codon:yes gene_type:complete